MNKNYSKTFEAKTENLEQISIYLDNILKKIRINKEIREEILIAVDEAATNIIMHSYKGKEGGKIRVNINVNNDKIEISLFDNGQTFDPSKIKEPIFTNELDTRKIGGLGIFLMKKFMDEVTFYLKNTNLRNENEVRMVKYLKKNSKEVLNGFKNKKSGK